VGKSGIGAHIKDINDFLVNGSRLEKLKEEMVHVFSQKRRLGLVDCSKDIESFSDELPMLLLVLVNHKPGSARLRSALDSLPDSPRAEVHMAAGCFMGYGLFDQVTVPFDRAFDRFASCI